MFEVTLLIPVKDNEGESFTPTHHAQFEAALLDAFGGFTRYGSATGGWADAGVVYADTLVIYAVAVGSIVDAAKIGTVAQFAKVHYRQLAVYVRYLGQAEVL
jgi:hypothetical protein